MLRCFQDLSRPLSTSPVWKPVLDTFGGYKRVCKISSHSSECRSLHSPQTVSLPSFSRPDYQLISNFCHRQVVAHNRLTYGPRSRCARDREVVRGRSRCGTWTRRVNQLDKNGCPCVCLFVCLLVTGSVFLFHRIRWTSWVGGYRHRASETLD